MLKCCTKSSAVWSCVVYVTYNRQDGFSWNIEKKEKTIPEPSKKKKKKEEPEHQTIAINTLSSSGNFSKFAKEMLKKPAFNNKSKEKVALKLNSLNDKKTRSKSN